MERIACHDCRLRRGSPRRPRADRVRAPERRRSTEGDSVLTGECGVKRGFWSTGVDFSRLSTSGRGSRVGHVGRSRGVDCVRVRVGQRIGILANCRGHGATARRGVAGGSEELEVEACCGGGGFHGWGETVGPLVHLSSIERGDGLGLLASSGGFNRAEFSRAIFEPMRGYCSADHRSAAQGRRDGSTRILTVLSGPISRVVGGPIWAGVFGCPCSVFSGERGGMRAWLGRGWKGLRAGSRTSGRYRIPRPRTLFLVVLG